MLGAAAIAFIAVSVHAAEGMWTLDNLPRTQLKTQYQFEPSEAWIQKVMRSTVRVGRGCSGSFISAHGLVLTNHHCLRRCIQALSSNSRNLITDGFLARTMDKEMACPDLELDQLDQVTDVTDIVKAATAGKDASSFADAYSAIAGKVTENCMIDSREYSARCDVVTLYHGGRYYLHRYHLYQDVRLVWAPEFATALFGGDPDNFNFPRYNLDASVLRVYENGKPIDTADFFKIKEQGVSENDVTFVTGYPGTTQRELTNAQLIVMRDVRLIRQLILLSDLRGTLSQYGKSGSEAERIAFNDLMTTENQLKAFHGRLTALQSESLLNAHMARELRLQKYVNEHSELAFAKNAWQEIANAEQLYRSIGNEYYFIEQERGLQSTYFSFAKALVRAQAERSKPDAERLPEFTKAAMPNVEQNLLTTAPIYPALERIKLTWSLIKLREWLGADHPVVKKILGNESPEVLAARLIRTTRLGDLNVRRRLWNKPDLIRESNDPFIKLALAIEPDSRAIRQQFDNQIESVERRAGQAIAEARFAMSGTNTYPDATFSLRLSFGEVKGWLEGGKPISPFTDIAGAFQRHTGSQPYALPKSWLVAKSQLQMELPFNFVTTNDIIGGNSGSPIINRDAELVGLAFDGNIHSLGGAYGFDEAVNRTVALHPAALVEGLKKIYHAEELLKELNVK